MAAKRKDERADKLAILMQMMAGKSLREICRQPEMPSRSLVHEWIAADPEFADQYAKAMDIRADAMFDELFEIADNATNDWMEAQDDQGGVGYKLNGEHINRSRLRVDTRKWALARMSPKKYGDRMNVDASGSFTVKISDSDANL